MRRLALTCAAASLIALGALGSERASAQPARNAFVHMVRPGETLASISERYYGEARFENVLVAENGLVAHGGASIVVGMRLIIPWVTYHQAAEGDTWARLADRFYGETRRGFILAEANRAGDGAQPDVGAQLLIPYPLRHVADQGDTVRGLAETYYNDNDRATDLKRFNGIRGNRLSRGQIVLVPIRDLVLSQDGSRHIEEATGQAPETGDLRADQERIDEQVPQLRVHVERGRFAQAIALSSELLGSGKATDLQKVSLYRWQAIAYVALGREDLAVAAFREVIQRQPDFELDNRTSPTVRRALRQAHAQATQPSEPEPEAAPEEDSE